MDADDVVFWAVVAFIAYKLYQNAEGESVLSPVSTAACNLPTPVSTGGPYPYT